MFADLSVKDVSLWSDAVVAPLDLLDPLRLALSLVSLLNGCLIPSPSSELAYSFLRSMSSQWFLARSDSQLFSLQVDAELDPKQPNVIPGAAETFAVAQLAFVSGVATKNRGSCCRPFACGPTGRRTTGGWESGGLLAFLECPRDGRVELVAREG